MRLWSEIRTIAISLEEDRKLAVPQFLSILTCNKLCTSMRSLRRHFKSASTKGPSARTAIVDARLKNSDIITSHEVVVVSISYCA